MAGIGDILSFAENVRAERGGRSDTVVSEAPVGAFVVPARDVSAIGDGDTMTGAEILRSLFPDQTAPDHPRTPVRLSRGEVQLPPVAVDQMGADGLWVLIDLLKGRS